MFSVIAVANTHLYKDIEKRLKIVLVSITVVLEHLNYYKLHGTSPITSTTYYPTSLLSRN